MLFFFKKKNCLAFSTISINSLFRSRWIIDSRVMLLIVCHVFNLYTCH